MEMGLGCRTRQCRSRFDSSTFYSAYTKDGCKSAQQMTAIDYRSLQAMDTQLRLPASLYCTKSINRVRCASLVYNEGENEIELSVACAVPQRATLSLVVGRHSTPLPRPSWSLSHQSRA